MTPLWAVVLTADALPRLVAGAIQGPVVFFFTMHWDLDDDPNGNVQHILRRHGITREQFEQIFRQARYLDESSNSEFLTALGRLPNGQIVRILCECVADDEYDPITAFPTKPEGK